MGSAMSLTMAESSKSIYGAPPNSTPSGRVNTSPATKLHIDEGVGCVLGFGADPLASRCLVA